MASVRYDQATRIYAGTEAPAVDALNLEIEDGEFLVLVGPSGSGKTTALRMLAGLEEVDAGTIYIGERDVTDLPPKRRDVAMVFQNYALYPYLTVAANIAFPLRVARVPKEERDRKTREVAHLLGLEEYLERKPGQLSGGQRQRVAMGRAIIRQPSVFLMDEPLSNLDAKLRVQMRAEIAALQSRLGTTTVYVTHDQSEAMTLGDRVAVLGDGKLQQCDTPRGLYAKPANVFVAGFIGSPAMNLCHVTCANGCVSLGGVSFSTPDGAHGDIVVGLRPESLELAAEGIPAEVEMVEEIGADSYVFAAAGVGKLVARVETKLAPERGARITLRPRAGEAHLFDPATGARLSG
ncbi:MAG TPA: ABC transporter ATP-binding protein [Gaiellaceae bacterium]|jgi:multiple sugar transport system ATP-binding protein|nr:ABC transporter ATP-binding protein [Gaiellaceae bacterium]